MPTELIPPDLNQCQSLVKRGADFMKLGSSRSYARCTNKPAVVATEAQAGADGLKGSMSLCEDCKEALIKMQGESFAEFESISLPNTEEQT